MNKKFYPEKFGPQLEKAGVKIFKPTGTGAQRFRAEESTGVGLVEKAGGRGNRPEGDQPGPGEGMKAEIKNQTGIFWAARRGRRLPGHSRPGLHGGQHLL